MKLSGVQAGVQSNRKHDLGLGKHNRAGGKGAERRLKVSYPPETPPQKKVLWILYFFMSLHCLDHKKKNEK